MKEIVVFVILLFIIWYKWKEKYVLPIRFQSHHPDDKLRIQRLKEKLSVVHPIIAEIDVYPSKSDTYTLGKSEIHLCLGNEENSPYFENFLVYAYLHEIAHVLTPSQFVGPPDDPEHPPEFEKINNRLLAKAEKLGLYNSYLPCPNRYCKKHINEWKN